jgi:DNA-binding NarL/FixJ family response regulator
MPATSHPTPRILVVEDDYFVAIDLEDGLREAGMQVLGPVSTAEAALALAHAERPILAVMDIRLAGQKDGIEAALELYRELGIRCIFASAQVEPPYRQRAAPARPLGWVQKPYTLSAVVAAVKNALPEAEQNLA